MYASERENVKVRGRRDKQSAKRNEGGMPCQQEKWDIEEIKADNEKTNETGFWVKFYQ